ncbi:MAG: hypothetical protein F6K22_36280 [Okeania sp. SIO2F4]|uniref:hypothetical protein n=1 Tax=Okeania sp. SIO2F4 TaxID=2607790 RepID=UPI0014290927|nr:hypothetical protein [Okeania sp. SIO2F4]NES07772.1 hypothetical protein [Okeania sp. SIO2F4]
MFAGAKLSQHAVGNDSLANCKKKHSSGEKKTTNTELQKLLITQAKKTENRECLSEVPVVLF